MHRFGHGPRSWACATWVDVEPACRKWAFFEDSDERKMGRKQGPGTVRNLDSPSVLFSNVWNGGEGGIRTRQDPLDSVSYRF
jgi:hypothetical protein